MKKATILNRDANAFAHEIWDWALTKLIFDGTFRIKAVILDWNYDQTV